MGVSGAVVASGKEATFPKSEFDARMARAREGLAARGIDVMIITGPENIYYLTGQQTPGYYTYQALLLPVDGEPVFIVRQLELNNLVANSHLTNIRPYLDNADPVAETVNAIDALGWRGRRLAIDERGWFLPIAIYKALVASCGELGNGAGVVERLRAVKSPAEIGKIETAARYTDAGMSAGLAAVRVGASENDVVAAMMGAAIAAGSEYVGMEPLMSSGERSGVPHGTWRRRIIGPGDPVFLELAACHDRYHATLMRSAWIGRPDDVALRMMDCCIEALDAALAALRPGKTCAEVHEACQGVIDRYGYTENFKKRTGYSIGISFAPDWGEGNVLSLYSGIDVPIEKGMVFHLPPALRIYGKFTVGVSATAVVEDEGCRELSGLSRDMLIV
ncbi:MAG: M24 family metallopeptidase [Rhizobiales bacterium]|nr:M24 family metallopeptidase [Hyphomicrobiales bacterium]